MKQSLTLTPASAAAWSRPLAPVSPLAGQGGDRQQKGDLMSFFPQPCAFPCLLLPVKHPVINYTTLQPLKIYLEFYVCCCCHLHNGKCAVAANGSLKGITPLELLWGQGEGTLLGR